MKNFFVIINRAKEKAHIAASKVSEFLISNGADCMIDSSDPALLNGMYTDPDIVPKDTECVIVLGGDGTILQAANDLADMDVAFLGVNFGTLGFLSEVDHNELPDALKRLLNDDYYIEERMMLSGDITSDISSFKSKDALNDIVITRKGSLEILNYTVFINGRQMNRYNADGIIIATPTGSTGYSLSAGGPIINPKSRMIMLTPICPHSMHDRSILFSPEDEVVVRIDEKRDGRGQEVEVIFDGCHRSILRTGDYVSVRESSRNTKIIKLKEESFLMTLQKKLKDV